MGSRGRSIRLRIYFLVAIPLIALVGLLAYVAGTSINNAISLDRAPNLVNATAIPAAEFGVVLQAERAAAVVYLFQPTAANLAAYECGDRGDRPGRAGLHRRHELPGHHGHRELHRGQGGQQHGQRAEPAPGPA